MKKLIVLSVVFALVAGMAFAETTIGGNLKISADVFQGTNEEKAQVQAGGPFFWDGYTNVNWSGDNAGGMMRLYTGAGNEGPKATDHEPRFVYWWWRPNDMLRLKLGVNPDGDWGHAQISGWGFNGEAQGGIALDEWRGINGTASLNGRKAGGSNVWGATGGAPGAWGPGFSSPGLTVELTPVPGLAFNLGIPYGATTKTAADIYLHTYVNVSYRIEDIGTIRVSSQIAPGYNEGDADKWYGAAGTADTTQIWASFYLMAVDGMGIDLGFGYRLPLDTGSMKTNYPVGIGLGFNFFGGGDFGFKARAGMTMGGSTEIGGVEYKGPAVIGINILPSYNLGTFVAYLNAGFGLGIPDEGDNHVDWYLNPYIRVGVSQGNFYVGFKLWTDGEKWGDDKNKIFWGLPIGWNVYF